MIKVINVRKGFPLGAVYVGRQTPQFKGSVLANPFKLHSEAERAKVLAQYEAWLDQRLTSPESRESLELERLCRLAVSGDLILACWCAPAQCHADIIMLRIEEKLAEAAHVSL